MGYHGTQPDEAVAGQPGHDAAEALQAGGETDKSIYRVFPAVSIIDAQTLRDRRCTNSQAKIWHATCRGCSEVCLMAATLGIGAGSPDCPRVCSSDERRSDPIRRRQRLWSRPAATRSTIRIRQDSRSGAACTVDRGSVPVTVIFPIAAPAGFQPPAGYAAQDWS